MLRAGQQSRAVARGSGGSVLVAARRAPPRRAAMDVRASGAAKVGARDLQKVAEAAAAAGAKVITEALDKPRVITSKGAIGDIVTDTDKASEAAAVAVISAAFPGHAILGEEGGVITGDVASEYLWCIDPLDGTCNFAHNYPGFCCSIGVLRHSTPVAGCVVEFVGGPGAWRTRTYSAARNFGATCDGRAISVSKTSRIEDALVASELCWYEDLWPTMAGLHAEFTRTAMGTRMSGAAAANLCHLAAGLVDAYWQFQLKPWDVAAGVCILEEAGGRVSTADGLAYSVFDRSLLASNDALYSPMLAVLEPRMRGLIGQGIKLGPANVPKGYGVRLGSQLD
ncbi:phosphatase, chloroplastic [Raphidocelis subcapitata]|uniref:Inositol-1-monophosphatase n=1 Tax=Raphidocelis subcapitata TaxID=307507 RepID=A0A2V0NZD7_9CHLO|nr:phosphatase, chloroplastic [Raphidocelis subcapitata]|eukprot:GBF90287.1 phosphatase, chloroplastic [Raphidocelis subcapitata]